MKSKRNETNSDGLAMLGAIVGTANESVDDVIKFMMDYAKGMLRRHRDAVAGDKAIACNIVAMRMEDIASRVKRALKRERSRHRAEVRNAKGRK